MTQYIDKSALVAEIEKRLHANGAFDEFGDEAWAEDVGMCNAYKSILSFLDTLEVKEVYEYNDVNLNPLFEEMGVEPDSRIALMFKNAFYKSVDNYLGKKENKL